MGGYKVILNIVYQIAIKCEAKQSREHKYKVPGEGQMQEIHRAVRGKEEGAEN